MRACFCCAPNNMYYNIQNNGVDIYPNWRLQHPPIMDGRRVCGGSVDGAPNNKTQQFHIKFIKIRQMVACGMCAGVGRSNTEAHAKTECGGNDQTGCGYDERNYIRIRSGICYMRWCVSAKRYPVHLNCECSGNLQQSHGAHEASRIDKYVLLSDSYSKHIVIMHSDIFNGI